MFWLIDYNHTNENCFKSKTTKHGHNKKKCCCHSCYMKTSIYFLWLNTNDLKPISIKVRQSLNRTTPVWSANYHTINGAEVRVKSEHIVCKLSRFCFKIEIYKAKIYNQRNHTKNIYKLGLKETGLKEVKIFTPLHVIQPIQSLRQQMFMTMIFKKHCNHYKVVHIAAIS